MSVLKPQSKVLFIGDSITDAGRDRTDPDDLGRGYPRLVAATYAEAHPGDGVRFLNRGISGNRVRDLRARWEPDCLDLAPDVVSVMIGINDTWRRYDRADATSAEDFAADYERILALTTDRLTARLVLVEPFLLPVRPGQDSWREDLDPKIAVVRRLAREYAATLVPLDTIVTAAAANRDAAELAGDGVHPTMEGHALIAGTWLEATT
ncbi:SGNH/GDSL hydrolase family protein [Actinopolymorpha pittospori]